LAPAAGFEPASFSVNSRARSPRVLDRKNWWRQSVTLRPRRSCKDHLHPCAVPVVPRVGFEATSPRFQRGAFTRLASSAFYVEDGCKTPNCWSRASAWVAEEFERYLDSHQRDSHSAT